MLISLKNGIPSVTMATRANLQLRENSCVHVLKELWSSKNDLEMKVITIDIKCSQNNNSHTFGCGVVELLIARSIQQQCHVLFEQLQYQCMG